MSNEAQPSELDDDTPPWIQLSFVVCGERLVPAEFTAIVGHEPSRSFAMGDEYASVEGVRTAEGIVRRQSTQKRRWGLWQLRTHRLLPDRGIDDVFLLSVLECRADAIRSYVAKHNLYSNLRIRIDADRWDVSVGA